MIEANYFYLNVFALSVGTLLIRGFFIAMASKMQVSNKMKQLFTFIPAAIFPALIVPATFFHQGSVEWLSGKERLTVLFLSAVFCYFVRKTLYVVGFGLIVLYFIIQL